jgi:transcriptional regulator with XRE-family HTH domain
MQQSIDTLFGRHLKSLRKRKRKSVNMFSYENDLTPATISRIENGLISPRLKTLKKIADALDISLSELFRSFKY